MIQISFAVTRAVAATFIVFFTVNAQVAAHPGTLAWRGARCCRAAETGPR